MPTRRDTLTSNEVAVVASVPIRYLSHLLEKHILPDTLYAREGRRWFLPSAAAFVAFDHQWVEVLTLDARRHALLAFATKYPALTAASDAWLRWAELGELGVEVGPVRLSLGINEVLREVVKNWNSLMEARALVVRDAEILSGTPVIRGTRIPVHDVAASVDKGLPMARIMRAYSDLTERDIELACLWARANPPMGRPKRAIGPGDLAATKRVARWRAVA